MPEKLDVELVVMVGVSGSGKSTYAKKHYHTHVIHSLDDISEKDRKIWLNKIEQSLKKGESVVADDENVSKTRRKKLIDLARKYNVRVIAVYLNYPLEKILEQNQKREGLAKVSEQHISEMHRAMRPKLNDEGFDDVIEVKQ